MGAAIGISAEILFPVLGKLGRKIFQRVRKTAVCRISVEQLDRQGFVFFGLRVSGDAVIYCRDSGWGKIRPECFLFCAYGILQVIV